MTNPVGTVIGSIGAVQRLHFVLILLEGTKEEFLDQLLPAQGSTKEDVLWKEELGHQAGIIEYQKLTGFKEALIEAAKLQAKHAEGVNDVRRRKTEL